MDAALATARETNDKSLLIRALVARGCVVIYEADAARPYFAEAAHLARDVGDSWRLSQILERQSYVAMFVAGDLHGTVSAANEGRELAQKIGDSLTSHQCGIYIAGALYAHGDLRQAAAQARSVTIEARAAHDLLSAMTGLMSESICLALQGNSSDAQSAIRTALDGAPEIGSYFESACYPNLALVHLAAGDVSAAWEACERALPTISHDRIQRCEHQLGGPARHWPPASWRRQPHMADVAVSMARGCWVALGLTSRARVKIALRRVHDQQKTICMRRSSPPPRVMPYLCIPDALECLAHLACDTDSHSEAARLLGAAHALRQRMGAVRLKVFDADYDALVLLSVMR